jgi:hypothetical protein
MSSSSVVPITPDVLVQNEGTVFLFCPLRLASPLGPLRRFNLAHPKLLIP